MDDQHSNLDELQAAYKAAVEEWISAIRKEEALASVNHSVAEVDLWENAGFQGIKDKIRRCVAREVLRILEPFPFRLDRRLYLLILTRFFHANRYPPRI